MIEQYTYYIYVVVTYTYIIYLHISFNCVLRLHAHVDKMDHIALKSMYYNYMYYSPSSASDQHMVATSYMPTYM